MENCIENQSQFSEIVAKLINNLDFDDTQSNEKEENKETKNDDSSSSDNNEEQNTAEKAAQQSGEADLNIAETSQNLLDEESELDQKQSHELEGAPSSQIRSTKKLERNKYKIFTTEYDEIVHAEAL